MSINTINSPSSIQQITLTIILTEHAAAILEQIEAKRPRPFQLNDIDIPAK